jgi:hypothetical protein
MSIYHNYQAVAESGLGIGNFFNISISDDVVFLLGWHSHDTIENCKKLGYEFVWDNLNNRLMSENKKIRIILAPKPF